MTYCVQSYAKKRKKMKMRKVYIACSHAFSNALRISIYIPIIKYIKNSRDKRKSVMRKKPAWAVIPCL